MAKESGSKRAASCREARHRRSAVLKAIIEEYVRSAHPVASASVVHLTGIPVSSATVRNDMAALEDAGLIVRPHASAGRVPSGRGYRRFVDELMEPARLTAGEQRTVLHQFHQIEGRLGEWPMLALALLTRMVPAAAIVTAPRRKRLRVRDVHLAEVGAGQVQVVVTLEGGSAISRIVELDVVPEEPWLQPTAVWLARVLRGMSGRQVASIAAVAAPHALKLVEAIADMVGTLEREQDGSARFAGVSELLVQPEFADVARARSLLRLLEGGALVHRLHSVLGAGAGVRVFIGGEHGLEFMRDYSAVLAPYGNAQHGEGVVGVVGPQRLPYRRAIGSVDIISTALSGLAAAQAA